VNYARDITETVGRTPLVRLNRVVGDSEALVLAKLERFNPLSSVKDRTALAMIDAAEEAGELGPDSVVVEATTGNTGIGLAFVCAARGYRCIIVVPEFVSIERARLLRALGAEVVFTPAREDMAGARRKALEIAASSPRHWMAQQFSNPANPAVHRETTAAEIWADTAGRVDVFVAGIGTGGTVTGAGAALKQMKPTVRVVGVEPAESALLTGGRHRRHPIEGLGAGYMPEVLDPTVLDEVIDVANEDARDMTRRLAREEGIVVGLSSGCAAWAAIQVAARPASAGQVIVVLFPDLGERYLSTETFDLPSAARARMSQ
jgi:cysteine synthase A